MAIFTCIITFQLIWSVFSCSEWTVDHFFQIKYKYDTTSQKEILFSSQDSKLLILVKMKIKITYVNLETIFSRSALKVSNERCRILFCLENSKSKYHSIINLEQYFTNTKNIFILTNKSYSKYSMKNNVQCSHIKYLPI